MGVFPAVDPRSALSHIARWTDRFRHDRGRVGRFARPRRSKGVIRSIDLHHSPRRRSRVCVHVQPADRALRRWPSHALTSCDQRLPRGQCRGPLALPGAVRRRDALRCVHTGAAAVQNSSCSPPTRAFDLGAIGVQSHLARNTDQCPPHHTRVLRDQCPLGPARVAGEGRLMAFRSLEEIGTALQTAR